MPKGSERHPGRRLAETSHRYGEERRRDAPLQTLASADLPLELVESIPRSAHRTAEVHQLLRRDRARARMNGGEGCPRHDTVPTEWTLERRVDKRAHRARVLSIP